jgi:hypothetical protein
MCPRDELLGEAAVPDRAAVAAAHGVPRHDRGGAASPLALTAPDDRSRDRHEPTPCERLACRLRAWAVAASTAIAASTTSTKSCSPGARRTRSVNRASRSRRSRSASTVRARRSSKRPSGDALVACRCFAAIADLPFRCDGPSPTRTAAAVSSPAQANRAASHPSAHIQRLPTAYKRPPFQRPNHQAAHSNATKARPQPKPTIQAPRRLWRQRASSP